MPSLCCIPSNWLQRFKGKDQPPDRMLDATPTESPISEPAASGRVGVARSLTDIIEELPFNTSPNINGARAPLHTATSGATHFDAASNGGAATVARAPSMSTLPSAVENAAEILPPFTPVSTASVAGATPASQIPSIPTDGAGVECKRPQASKHKSTSKRPSHSRGSKRGSSSYLGISSGYAGNTSTCDDGGAFSSFGDSSPTCDSSQSSC